MKDKILVICPTHGRPIRAFQAYESWKKTNKGFSDFMLAIDETTDQIEAYSTMIKNTYAGMAIQYCPKGRRGMVDCFNFAACSWAKIYKYIFFMGDDHQFRTEGWDKIMFEKLEEQGGGYAYGNDLLQGANIPTACAIDTRIIRTLGYACLPTLAHLYVDNYWLSLGRAIGKISYLSDVVIEHMHWANGKAVKDENYDAIDAPEIANSDHAIYHEWLTNGLSKEVELLKTVYEA